MSIQVSEKMIDVFSCGGVSVPFPDVIRKECLVNMADGLFVYFCEMLRKVGFQVHVKVFAEQVGYAPSQHQLI